MSTTVWISGASQGLGAALARTMPLDGATIVNLSRRRQPGVENVYLDLCDPLTWPAVEASFAAGLAAEGMERAIFIHNAVHPGGSGMVVDIGSDEFGAAVLANVAAPLVLAGAFARHCHAGVDARVALVSSNAAGVPFPGASVYCAGKAAIEHWVRAVRREVEHDRRTPSVMAIRPDSSTPPGPARRPAAIPCATHRRQRRSRHSSGEEAATRSRSLSGCGRSSSAPGMTMSSTSASCPPSCRPTHQILSEEGDDRGRDGRSSAQRAHRG